MPKWENREFIFGSIRPIESQQAILDQALQTENLQEALWLIYGLLDKPMREETVVTRYNSKTGEPTYYEWQPVGVWEGRVWIDERSIPPLTERLLQLVPKGQARSLLLNDEGDIIVVTHMPRQFDYQGMTSAYFKFQKVEKLESIG